jgi:uncharacterized glyoxalase superfamily protein PhnB
MTVRRIVADLAAEQPNAANTFYGDVLGDVRDPFGRLVNILQHN